VSVPPLDKNSLTPEERQELDRLWLNASVEASKQGVVLVSYLITGQPLRPTLEALRDGSWRKRIDYGS
jgi:hypothetical protein